MVGLVGEHGHAGADARFVERTEAAYARGGDWREGVRRQGWEVCQPRGPARGRATDLDL